MPPEIQSVVGLVVGVAALIFLVVRTKVHVFPALLIAASIIELVGGRAPPDTVEAIPRAPGTRSRPSALSSDTQWLVEIQDLRSVGPAELAGAHHRSPTAYVLATLLGSLLPDTTGESVAVHEFTVGDGRRRGGYL